MGVPTNVGGTEKDWRAEMLVPDLNPWNSLCRSLVKPSPDLEGPGVNGTWRGDLDNNKNRVHPQSLNFALRENAINVLFFDLNNQKLTKHIIFARLIPKANNNEF